MRVFGFAALIIGLGVLSGCATGKHGAAGHAAEDGDWQTVEAGCSMCIYQIEHLAGCRLAVKIDGRPYLVEGLDMYDFGDPHEERGLCMTARQARVRGHIADGKFVAQEMVLVD